MIKIIYDSQDLTPPQENKVREISQYPQVVKECLANLGAGRDQTIILAHSVLVQWLKRLAQRCPPGAFSFETLDARTALVQRWGLPIPAAVTNSEILQANLLSLELAPLSGQSFEDLLLSHFFAPALAAPAFPKDRLGALLTAIQPPKWSASRAQPLLERTLQARLAAWKAKASTADQRALIDLFAEDPAALRRQLMQYRVLAAYPELGPRLLGEAWAVFAGLKLRLPDLPVAEDQIPEVVLQVTYLLNRTLLQSEPDLDALLSRVSGLLQIEYQTLEGSLLNHPDWINAARLSQLEIKFAGLPVAQRLEALRRQIRPPKPESPDPAWNLPAMLEWATQRYLPYQAWCSAQNQFDLELYAQGDRFSEWLINHWDLITANSGRMVFNILPNLAPHLQEAGAVHLILVVDNLGWTFADILIRQFQDKGCFLTRQEPYLAMLPTETEVSKKCLLAGATGYTSIDDRSYRGMIERGWVPYFGENKFRYLSDIGSLAQVDQIDVSAYVVNYLAVDKALHKSADEIGMSHAVHIEHLLFQLVENVYNFIVRHRLQERICIHVVSDHGSTRIPETAINDLRISDFKEPGFEARSHRYVAVTPERFSALPDNLRHDCFFLPSNQFGNPSHFLSARRANRFLPTDQNSYVHGGLLPEEVIVPYLVFQLQTTPLQPLTLMLVQSTFRYRSETINLEVGNPNASVVEQITVAVLNSNVESQPVSLPSLNGMTNGTLSIPVRFRLTSQTEEQKALRLQISFRARGQLHAFEAVLPITMRRMVEEKSDGIFDD